MEPFGLMYLFGILLSIVLVICWIVLPFAIIGTKPLLRELIKEVKALNTTLSRKAHARTLEVAD